MSANGVSSVSAMIEELEPELRLAETFGEVNVATPDNAVLCGMQPNNGGALAVDVPVESVGNKDVLHKYTFYMPFVVIVTTCPIYLPSKTPLGAFLIGCGEGSRDKPTVYYDRVQTFLLALLLGYSYLHYCYYYYYPRACPYLYPSLALVACHVHVHCLSAHFGLPVFACARQVIAAGYYINASPYAALRLLYQPSRKLENSHHALT